MNGARVLWRGQLGIRGNCLAHPFSKFEGCRSLGSKSGAKEEWKLLRPRRRPDSRTAGLRSWVGEARRWEVPEEGVCEEVLKGAWPSWGKKGFPFLQKGEKCGVGMKLLSRRDGWGLGMADDVKVRGMKEMLSLLWG